MVMHTSTTLRAPLTICSADTIVKVPQMAESITEGTLKQFSKRMYSTCAPVKEKKKKNLLLNPALEIGDYVERDEEIATIETDKVCSRVGISSGPSRVANTF
jgi:hypothetical protein